MPIFSRGKGEVLDLPDLNRRGLFKFPEVKNEEEEIDFTNPLKNNLSVEITAQETSLNKEISSNVSNFFSDFLAIGVANSSVVPDNFPKSESSEHQKIDALLPKLSDLSGAKFLDDRSFEHTLKEDVGVRNYRHQKIDLKWRVENSEYQIEQLLQRIAELERKSKKQ